MLHLSLSLISFSRNWQACQGVWPNSGLWWADIRTYQNGLVMPKAHLACVNMARQAMHPMFIGVLCEFPLSSVKVRKPLHYEKEEVGVVQSQGTETFFSKCRKFPQVISSAGTPLMLLIPFNTTINSHFLSTVAVSLFKRLGWFSASRFTLHFTTTWWALWVEVNVSRDGCCTAQKSV